ncbi:binding-protein-dependent transport systems inner membrane component [Methylocella silvestris BL2]|uniref:Binding-protein-dependent transport systems inner membrane component n=1 Tax=Methylocella silvestris (strain DSM 15510 / CIP 108128 / LMG 27833 / NCIMB 13906 / BL2) TaxID=395965 RepID=B8ETB1_METSB|nr:ABC transporter permease [Methylocella silvestris]ACK51753.1 binding-protein-dependent transport systems inner membrane component [Methylocella silvestris BL2]
MSLILDSAEPISAPAAARGGSRFGAGRIIAPLLGVAVLAAAWTLAGAVLARNPATMAFAGFAPGPTLTRLWTMLVDGSVWRAFTPSASRVGWGLGFAIVIGAPVGVLVGRSRFFREATYIPFQLVRMISPLAWMPIAILLFATWDGAIVFLIAAAAVWPIVFAVAHGLKKLDPDWFKVAHNLGANPWHVLTAVIIPATAQDFLSGVRLAAGVAWIVLVPAEFLGVTSGLGYAINDARDTLEYDRLGAIVLVIGVIGFVFDGLLLALIRRVSWTRRD